MVGQLQITKKYNLYSLGFVINYFNTLTVSYHDMMSLFGFFTFLILFNQLISGVMLALSLVPESMVIPLVREEEDVENLYIDDFFWLHERGVDLLFIFVFLHLFRKLFLNVGDLEQEFAWKSGTFSFLIIQVVVFLGLVLCCTHLSEITLTIAANALHTFFLFKGKFYWWVFTDQTLNTDTVIRLAYAHYVSAFFLVFLGVVHGTDMHYDWKNEQTFDGAKQELPWWDDVLGHELGRFLEIVFWVGFFSYWFYEEPEALNYELFMWGDIGMTNDIRFYGVAPHWYFRPYMAWLIACPYHHLGLLGLLFFFLILYFQPNIMGSSSQERHTVTKSVINILWIGTFSFNKYILKFQKTHSTHSLYFIATYFIFLVCVGCTLSYLPYGRFYTRLGGNFSLLFSYLFLFIYLGTTFLRSSLLLQWSRVDLINY